MKLPIKDEYFKELKLGRKTVEYRDAHITFVNEKTGETLKKNVLVCSVIKRKYVKYLKDKSHLFEDEKVIRFYLGVRNL